MARNRNSTTGIPRQVQHEGALALQNLFYRLAARSAFGPLSLAVWRLSTAGERALAFDKLESALRLIEAHAPERFKALRTDVRSIFVHGLVRPLGCYVHKHRRVELEERFVLNPETGPEALACVLVHEAQHARLWRLGFGYPEEMRARLERLCFQAERSFARRLPDGQAQIAEADAWLEADLGWQFSNQKRREDRIRDLRMEGAPGWMIGFAEWLERRRRDSDNAAR